MECRKTSECDSNVRNNNDCLRAKEQSFAALRLSGAPGGNNHWPVPSKRQSRAGPEVIKPITSWRIGGNAECLTCKCRRNDFTSIDRTKFERQLFFGNNCPRSTICRLDPGWKPEVEVCIQCISTNDLLLKRFARSDRDNLYGTVS